MLLLFGPRLDRPSAIGDEGRPRATSLNIAAFAVFLLFLAATATIDLLELLPTVGFVIGVMVAGMTMLDTNRIGSLLLGHLSFLPFASAFLGLVGLLIMTTPYGLLAAGLSISVLGIAGSWTDVLDSDHVRSVAKQSLISYVSMIGSLVGIVFFGGLGYLLVGLIQAFVGGVGPSASVVGFNLLLFGFGLSVRAALSVVPIAQLAPASERDALDERVTAWQEVATQVALRSLFATVALMVLWLAGVLEALYTTPGVATLFELFSSPFVAIPIVAGAVLCLVAAAGAWLIRRLTRDVDPSTARDLAAVIAGGLLLFTIVPLVATGLSVSSGYGYMMAIMLAVVGPPIVLIGMGIGLAAVQFGVLPDRASGPALAGAGLVVATIGASTASVPAPLVFACAAGALLVWDASSFGLGVTAELGHLPETRRLELFHGVLSVALGVVAVLALTGVDYLRVLLGSAVGAMPAAILAVVGVLAVLTPFRG